MSNLYNLEPQPTAKVVLQTTSGDITLELFAKQTPLASRNFLQHCLDGYYNNTIFHRLVPGFIVQGGDPTGSGSGGISALGDGEPFADEFHSRLKFNRRGLLGMANEGKDSNGSQFFFTLAATPELQGRNTMFGRVEGDTIYNLMKMADAELAEGEGSERPLYPTRITGAEILVNPFDDMVARAKETPRSTTAQDGVAKKVVKRKKPAGKNVLSFGGEDGEDLAPVVKKAKVNPKFAAAPQDEEETTAAALPQRTVEKVKPKAEAPRARKQEGMHAGREEIVLETTKAAPPIANRASVKPTNGHDDVEDEQDSEEETEAAALSRPSDLERMNAEIAKLKQSMKRTVESHSSKTEKPKSALEAMIPTSSTRGRKRGGKAATDEQDALDLFKAFKQRLEDLPAGDGTAKLTSTEPAVHNGASNGSAEVIPTSGPVADDEEAALCDLHFIPNCQSCQSWDTENHETEKPEDGDAAGWMGHTLSFAKDTLGKDLEWKRKMQEIEVIDPREKARELAGERKRAKERPR